MNLENQSHFKLYRWDMNSGTGTWRLQFTQKTDDIKLLSVLMLYNIEEPTPDFLMYELFDSNGVMRGRILTSHIYLFDI